MDTCTAFSNSSKTTVYYSYIFYSNLASVKLCTYSRSLFVATPWMSTAKMGCMKHWHCYLRCYTGYVQHFHYKQNLNEVLLTFWEKIVSHAAQWLCRRPRFYTAWALFSGGVIPVTNQVMCISLSVSQTRSYVHHVHITVSQTRSYVHHVHMFIYHSVSITLHNTRVPLAGTTTPVTNQTTCGM